MPTYLYKNLETGETYEFKQSINDAPLSHHPETGAALKRLVSPPGIAFKGSGFYVNDSRAGSSASKAGSDTKTKPEKVKPESKPAASGSAGE